MTEEKKNEQPDYASMDKEALVAQLQQRDSTISSNNEHFTGVLDAQYENATPWAKEHFDREAFSNNSSQGLAALNQMISFENEVLAMHKQNNPSKDPTGTSPNSGDSGKGGYVTDGSLESVNKFLAGYKKK